MASVTGSQLAFFATGNSSDTGSNINLVLTPDGTGTLTTVAGAFNIEVFTSSIGTPSLAPGFSASAFIQGAVTVSGHAVQAGSIGSKEELLDGSFKLVNVTAGETISVIGSGGGGSNDTVVGARNDTIVGSTNALNVQLIDGRVGVESIVGGAGDTNVLAGGFDSVSGAAGGGLTVVGGASGHLNITGGVGGVKAFDLGQRNLVTGGGGPVFIDDSYAGGGLSTLIGGSGSSNFIKGGSGDSLVGGNVGLTGQTIIDAHVGTNETVLGGPGAGTFILGGVGDKIFAGNSAQVFIAADLGSQTILGSTTNNVVGSSFTDVYFTGAGDSIVGQSGALTVAGSAAANLTIRGGTGNLDVFNLGTNSSVVGASTGTTFINDAYGAGGTDTLIGGGSATTIIAGANDSVVGKAGALDVRILSTFAGTTTINLSAAAAVVTDANTNSGTVTGAGGAASVTGFNLSIDKIKTSDTQAALHATETHDGSGNVILHFSDSTSMTIVGATDANQITFIA